MKYVLYNKKHTTYLKYIHRLRWKRYKPDIREATRFTKKEANRFLALLNPPENWEIIELKEGVKK